MLPGRLKHFLFELCFGVSILGAVCILFCFLDYLDSLSVICNLWGTLLHQPMYSF